MSNETEKAIGPDKRSVGQSEVDGLVSCADDYAYKTIEEFEEIVEYKVNEAFRAGWKMARLKNRHLGIGVSEEKSN